jgi:hypothetical protein
MNMKTGKYQIRYNHTSWGIAATKAGAIAAVKMEGGVSRLYIAAVPDGLYCYLTAARRTADDTGASAYAVICGPDQQAE